MREKQQSNQLKKRADQYNDPQHNYLRYWDERRYEHLSEEIAIKKFLKNKLFKLALDVGGGYGRLDILLSKYADSVILAEPSQQQLDLSADFLKNYPQVKRILMQADDLDFDDNSIDLVLLIRVLHHLPDPYNELSEINRVLKTNGYAIIEVANYAHFRNRIKYLLKRQKLPSEPVDIRSEANRMKDEIAFVNHNPHTIIRKFQVAGFDVVDVLSVSTCLSYVSYRKVLTKTASKILLWPKPILSP